MLLFPVFQPIMIGHRIKLLMDEYLSNVGVLQLLFNAINIKKPNLMIGLVVVVDV